MTIHSGKFGTVSIGSVVSTIANWMINETSTTARAVTSNSRAGTIRRKGIYDYNGSFEGWGAKPPVMPGQYFNFTGNIAPQTGVFGTQANAVLGVNAIVESAQLVWDWTLGIGPKWTVNFAAGQPNQIVNGTATDIDNSAASVCDLCGTFMQYGAIGTEVGNLITLPDVTQATLNITASNPTFVNSSTLCFTGRRPGNIDFTLSIAQENDVPLWNVGAINILSLPAVCIAAYWYLYWAILENISDLRVDNDTGAIVGMTYNWAMVANNPAGQIGGIYRPGDATQIPWWPNLYIAQTNPF